MSITRIPFAMLNQVEVTEYTLINQNGASVSILNYGGTIRRLCVPGREGQLVDVALGYDDLSIYEGPHSGCMGALIGRFANRIGGAAFTLEGKTYQLEKNNNGNNLHSGDMNYRRRIWDAEPVEGEEPSLKLSLPSPDGDQGYPGTLKVQVIYTLTNQNGLRIHYIAHTDKTTIVNMTNHAYFNLEGHNSGRIDDHVLQINAEYVTEASPELIPTGRFIPCKEVPYDFTTPTRVGDVLAKTSSDSLMTAARGVDFNYAAGFENQEKRIATLYGPATGIVMDVITDQPGVQCYTSQGLNAPGKEGSQYAPYHGICLETQHYPDSINKPYFPTVVLRPQDQYDTFTEYRFSVR